MDNMVNKGQSGVEAVVKMFIIVLSRTKISETAEKSNSGFGSDPASGGSR